jgi:hypothetical protein
VPARSSSRSLVLIVRAWVEEGRPNGFRARLIQADAPWATPSPSAHVVTASLDETLQAVRAWLKELEAEEDAPARGQRHGDGPVTGGRNTGGTPQIPDAATS